MNNSNKVSRFIGQTLGIVFVGCVAVCLCAIMIAGAVKFLTWVF